MRKSEQFTQNSTTLGHVIAQAIKETGNGTPCDVVHILVPRRFFTFSMSFSSSANSSRDLTSSVRQADGLPGADLHKTLYTESAPNMTVHFGSTEGNLITPLTGYTAYCADYQYKNTQ